MNHRNVNQKNVKNIFTMPTPFLISIKLISIRLNMSNILCLYTVTLISSIKNHVQMFTNKQNIYYTQIILSNINQDIEKV